MSCLECHKTTVQPAIGRFTQAVVASCWATTTSLSQYAQLPTCLCQQSSWQTLWKIINGSSTAVAHMNHISIPEYTEYFRAYTCTCTDLKNQGATMQGKWYRYVILTCMEAVETINMGLAQAHPNKALHVAAVSCTELVYYFECMKLQLTSTCCTLRKFWGYKNFVVPCKPEICLLVGICNTHTDIQVTMAQAHGDISCRVGAMALLKYF